LLRKIPSGEPLRWQTLTRTSGAQRLPLASGYPLHQPRKRGWFRYYPSRKKKALFFKKSAFFYDLVGWLFTAFTVQIAIAIPTTFAIARFMFFINAGLTSCKRKYKHNQYAECFPRIFHFLYKFDGQTKSK
jgi:hypothetical protein